MNKAELIETISEKAGLTKVDVEKVINGAIQVIVANVKKGEKVALAGFGQFELTKRAAKKGINPTTKEQISIPAKNAPKFKAAKAFKDAVQK